jgi:hypothetical protein
MSDEVIPVASPCNICGSVEFARGPLGRLSISKRLPLCSNCHSLERHRVVRTVFNALPDDLFKDTRCLQFNPDPALDPARFGEVVVSVSGGANSLDMEAIALPDASYHWTYSSHVINQLPNAPLALRELLRVVGDGCIVLSVGGTVFSYDTVESDRMLGQDRQFKVYGTMFADEIQRALPEVAVLELVAVDPSSVSIDSVYFASVDQRRLARMAEFATMRNVHARVFPARIPAVPAPTAESAKKQDPWATLQGEIEAWKAAGGSGRLWVRADDATSLEPRLMELVDLCEREAVPLTLAVIPLPMTLQLVELITERKLTPIQHGFDHLNREPSADKAKSEFPPERGGVETMRSIQLGWYILSEAFGERALPVFCPPWGTMAPKFRDRLEGLGFKGYSGSRIGSELHRQGTSPAGLRLASAHVAVNRPRRDGGNDLAETRILETLAAVVRAVRTDGSNEAVGIMTHHWGVDEEVRRFLKRLFQTTRAAGATWVGARDLFAPTPILSAQPRAATGDLVLP